MRAIHGTPFSAICYRPANYAERICRELRVIYTLSGRKEWALFRALAMQALLTLCAETLLKLVNPALPFLQRRPPWGPSARLIFLEQGNQRPQVLGQRLVEVGYGKAR